MLQSPLSISPPPTPLKKKIKTKQKIKQKLSENMLFKISLVNLFPLMFLTKKKSR